MPKELEFKVTIQYSSDDEAQELSSNKAGACLSNAIELMRQEGMLYTVNSELSTDWIKVEDHRQATADALEHEAAKASPIWSALCGLYNTINNTYGITVNDPVKGAMGRAEQALQDWDADKISDDPVLEINRELVLSTCHIEESTEAWLRNIPNYEVVNHPYEYGHRVYTGLDDDSDFHGVPETLPTLMSRARSQGCKWLVLDVSGPEVDELPSWGW